MLHILSAPTPSNAPSRARQSLAAPSTIALLLAFALGVGPASVGAVTETPAPEKQQQEKQQQEAQEKQAQNQQAQEQATRERAAGDEPRSVVPPEGEPDVLEFGPADRDGAPLEIPAEDGLSPAEDGVPSGSVEIVRARLRGEPGHRHVRGLDRLRRAAGRGEVSRQGSRMAFDAETDLGLRGLYLSRLDGTLERCASCDNDTLRKSHVLAPTWHPSGDYLVALVQGPGRRLGHETADFATPARGLHSELWAFTADGRDAWGLTRVVPQGGAVLDPAFSFEGDRLAWTERVATRQGGRWGNWVVRVAEFRIRRGLPRLGDVRTYEAPPGPGLVMVTGFTEDDRGLWLSYEGARSSARAGEVAGDAAGDVAGARAAAGGTGVGRLDLESGEFRPVERLGTRDEGMLEVPRSRRRVVLSDRDLSPPDRLPRVNELWSISESGRSRERLTFFNDPTARHSLGEAWIADTSWLPDGRGLLLHVLSPGTAGQVEEGLYLLELSPSFGE